MFEFVAYAAVLLTITVAVLSAFAVAARYSDNLREARIEAQRDLLLDAVRRFMDDQIGVAEVVPAMPRNRSIALSALVTAATGATPQQFPRLRALIQHLRLHEDDLAALHARDWTRRAHAATRLGLLRCHEAVPRLIHALEDPLLDVRLAAAHALAQLHAAHAVEPILRSLALPTSWPLQRCAEILHEMGHSAIAPLLAAQRGNRLSAAATTVAVKVLGMLRATAAVQVLITCLQHADDEIRVSSAKALGDIGDVQAAAGLRGALKDSAWPVRSAAARALGQVGAREAIADLTTMLADPAWWVRFNAAEALVRLGAMDTLRETVAAHADRFARDICRQVLEEHGAPPPAPVPA